MTDNDLSFIVHLMPGGADGGDLLGDLAQVVSRRVAIVYPPDVIVPLAEKLEAEHSLQVSLNLNVNEVRTEFDSLSSLNELGLLQRTDEGSATRYIDSAALLAQRNSTVQKGYENMFRSSLNIVAISTVFEKRTGEALPIATTPSPYG